MKCYKIFYEEIGQNCTSDLLKYIVRLNNIAKKGIQCNLSQNKKFANLVRDRLDDIT